MSSLPPSAPTPPAGRTTLDRYAAAPAPKRPHRLPTPFGELNPLGDEICGAAEPEAGRAAHRRDFGFVQHSRYPTEASHWDGLDLYHFYDAPVSAVSGGQNRPSPRLTGAFAPQTSAVRHAVRLLQHERAQLLPRRAGAESAPVIIASQALPPLSDPLPGAVANLTDVPGPGVGATRVARSGARPPALAGERQAGLTWPPPALPGTPEQVAFHRPWWRRSAAPAPRSRPPMLLDCAGRPGLPPAQHPHREAGSTTLRLHALSARNLPGAALAARFAAVRELWLVHCPTLHSLAGLLEALPQLRRLYVVGCPALAEVGYPPNVFAARVTLAGVLGCPAFGAADELVTAAGSPAVRGT